MTTQKEVDAINAHAVLLPQQDGTAEPPTIELREALVCAYIALAPAGEPVVVVNLHTDGVDHASVLAVGGSVLFELQVDGREIAGGVVSLDTGRVSVAA